MAFIDHFSSIATTYAAFRPTYPDELFAWLAHLAPPHAAVWDCGCGNGQASQGLLEHFDHVIATDASEAQIKEAKPNPKIDYRVARADQSALPGHSVDLLTVAQAVHWFDLDAFYAEARRVLKPRGLIALWGYGWTRFEDKPIDSLILEFQKETLHTYWPKQTEYTQQEYKTLPFPFDEMTPPSFNITTEWTLPQVFGHFRSWSAHKEYVKRHNTDPAEPIEKKLAALWGDANKARPVHWKIHMRAGRV